MSYKRSVDFTFNLPGIHRWPDAVHPVSYLADDHRHLFYISAGADVTHNDRDIEFITLQNKVREYLHHSFWNNSLGCLCLGTMSCEALAEFILEKFEDLDWCSVNEDDENGATLVRE